MGSLVPSIVAMASVLVFHSWSISVPIFPTSLFASKLPVTIIVIVAIIIVDVVFVVIVVEVVSIVIVVAVVVGIVVVVKVVVVDVVVVVVVVVVSPGCVSAICFVAPVIRSSFISAVIWITTPLCLQAY